MKYVVGIGNYTQFDDSIALKIVEYISEKALNKGFEVIDLSANALNIFSYLNSDTDKILIVDCAKMGKNPGEYSIFDFNDVSSDKEVGNISTHENDMIQIIKMAMELDYKIPEIRFMGIEPAEIKSEFGISPILKDSFPRYVEAIINEINTGKN
ncbi:MAG: [NiFe]-hydrogenase maturation endoprotease [uncultured bacterium]|nr:MAG: [NiFe]-hydrogenase maturation endoprotease [uncultured bacterium]